MNQYAQGYGTCYTRLQGRLFVTLEIPQPPADLEFLVDSMSIYTAPVNSWISDYPPAAPSPPLPLHPNLIPTPLFDQSPTPLDPLNLEVPGGWPINTPMNPIVEPHPPAQDEFHFTADLESWLSIPSAYHSPINPSEPPFK